jgi:hypothetical protein
MALLIANASGVAANLDDGINNPIYTNTDPVFVARTLLNTVYAWATTWSVASVQIFLSPQRSTSQSPIIWFPVGSPLTSNGFFTFQHRWGLMKAVVTGADGTTSGLNVSYFDGY